MTFTKFIAPGVSKHTDLKDTAGQWIVLSDTTLASAAASIDVTDLDNYPEYQVSISAQSSTATGRLLLMRFNNDSGNNYKYSGTNVWNAGSNSAAVGNGATSAMDLGNVAPNTGSHGIAEVFITNPATGTERGIISANCSDVNTVSSEHHVGIWTETTEVIDRITVFLDVDNLNTGTRMIIKGRSVA